MEYCTFENSLPDELKGRPGAKMRPPSRQWVVDALLRRGSPSCGAPSQFIALASQYRLFQFECQTLCHAAGDPL